MGMGGISTPIAARVGELADRSGVPRRKQQTIDAMIADLLSEGYFELDEDKMHYLDIEFPIEGEFANDEEV